MISIFNNTAMLQDEKSKKQIWYFFLFFLVFVFITTIAIGISGYLVNDPFKMGDWLINFQGGFVRRGLFGEMIYQISSISHISPGLFVLFFQISFYAIFFIFSFILLKNQKNILPYALLIISPFIFTFQIYTEYPSQGGFRKEIIYFALFAFFVYSAKFHSIKKLDKTFYLSLLLFSVLILVHEMLILFLPYFLIAYISKLGLNKKRFFKIIIFLIPSLISFILCIYFKGKESHSIAIYESLSNLNYPIEKLDGQGAISYLNSSTSDGMRLVKESIYGINYLISYFLILVFATIAYLPIFHKLKKIFSNSYSLILGTLSVIGTIALSIVALDWGRFIYIHLVSLFLLSFLNSNILNKRKTIKSTPIYKKYLIIVILLAYALLWHIPHCCSPNPFPKSINETNIMAYVKSYENIINFIKP